MANYEKNLFKHNQELIAENEKLRKKINKIETETANKYLGVIDQLKETVEILLQKCTVLEERVAKLEAENDRLRKQLNNDSGNSSKPPSTDIKPNAPNTYNERTKTGKKSGGQKGHKGKHLSVEAVEGKISEGLMTRKVVEHGTPGSNYISKYVIDLKIKAVAIEHRFYEDVKIPKQFRPDVQYGNEIKSVVATLAGQGLVASNRIVDMIAAMSNGAFELSDGTVYNFLSQFNSKVQTVVSKIKTKLLNNTVMNVDETGARINEHNMTFRNYSDANHVLYTANPTKGTKAIEADDVLPKFCGILVHDHNTVNYNYGTGNGECNVHLIRYLKANFENTKHDWSDDMIKFLLSVKRSKEVAVGFGANGFEFDKIEKIRKRFDAIIESGLEAHKTVKSKFYKEEERKLLNRLKKYRDNHLLFAENFDVPFDNNLSERDLRMVKTKAKVSGCFRSLQGAKVFANLMSVIKTATKQMVSPHVAIRSVFAGDCCIG